MLSLFIGITYAQLIYKRGFRAPLDAGAVTGPDTYNVCQEHAVKVCRKCAES